MVTKAPAQGRTTDSHARTVAVRSASATGRALVLASVLGLVGLGMAVPLRAWLAQQAEIASLQAQVTQARERVAALEVEQERWKDPAYVATQARERLLFLIPGEIGYVAIETTATDQVTPTQVLDTDVPWFVRLWGGLRSADANPSADTDPGVDAPIDAAPIDAGQP